MSLKRVNQPYFWSLFSISLLLGTPMIAQANQPDSAPIKQPSAFEAIDQSIGSDSLGSEIAFADDVKHVFVIESDEARIEKRSKNFEVVYQDILKQQTESHPIIRTQDISSTFNTSLLEMQK